MKRFVAFAALTLTGASISCSLLYRPSDYFDPASQVTAIGTSTNGANTIVLTSSLVVYATNNGIYALPKIGGDSQLITTFGANQLAAITSNETDLVAWCGSMGVQAWRPGGVVQTIDSATDCDTVSANGENIAAALTSAVADASTYQVFVYRGPSFGVDLEGGTPLPQGQGHVTSDRVSLTTNHGVYYALGEVIGRKPRPSDSLSKLDPFCTLGVAGGTGLDFRVVEVDAGPDAAPLILYRAQSGFRFENNDECCRVSSDGGNACPPAPLDLNTSYQAIVVSDPYVYYLAENELRRASIGDPEDAGALIRGDLGDAVGSLAVDADDAYLGVGDRILRVALQH